MTLADVLQPALDLARDGFPVHAGLVGPGDYLAFSIWHCRETFQEHWPTSAQLYLPHGRLPEVGTIFCNPDLARTFERLLEVERRAASPGRTAGLKAAREAFYTGDIAHQIATFVQHHGGLLDTDDLAVFETKVERPVSAHYRGYEVLKCGPWSQGPIFLQQLRLLEGYDLHATGHNTADYIYLVTEAAKLAFANREAYYGDPDFVHVPIQELLSEPYTSARRTLIDPQRASLELRPGDPVNGKALWSKPGPLVGREWQRGTVHVAVVGRGAPTRPAASVRCSRYPPEPPPADGGFGKHIRATDDGSDQRYARIALISFTLTHLVDNCARIHVILSRGHRQSHGGQARHRDRLGGLLSYDYRDAA
jgi:gamma-glutamyltranspeptidase/glutathione hydrolase